MYYDYLFDIIECPIHRWCFDDNDRDTLEQVVIAGIQNHHTDEDEWCIRVYRLEIDGAVIIGDITSSEYLDHLDVIVCYYYINTPYFYKKLFMINRGLKY